MHPSRRARPMSYAVVASLLVVIAFGGAAEAARRPRIDIRAFMTGLACIESGGRFDAVNRSSGALGKYQIMPRNWPAWTHRYIGNRWALPTPRNQEFVARQRLAELYEKFRSWRRTAYWWLTGDGEPDATQWSRKAAGYVAAVMRIASRAASPDLARDVPQRCFPVPFRDPKIWTEPLPRVKVKGGAVNVRLRPGYEHRALAVVRRGQRLAVLAKGSDPRGQKWLRVGLRDGRTGWIIARLATAD